MTAAVDTKPDTGTAYERYVAATLAAAPPLTAQQISRLTVLLRDDEPALPEVPRQRRAA